MVNQRTAQEIYSEIILLQTACHPPADKERLVQKLLSEFKKTSRLELQNALQTFPFVLVCSECDTGAPSSYEAALREGWQEIVPDQKEGWNFIGTCPNCVKAEAVQ